MICKFFFSFQEILYDVLKSSYESTYRVSQKIIETLIKIVTFSDIFEKRFKGGRSS